MLRPHKHMNPDQSVLALSAVILKRIRGRRVESYSDLLAFAKDKVPKADVLFPGSISLLFLLDLVEYRPKSDAFEYTGP